MEDGPIDDHDSQPSAARVLIILALLAGPGASLGAERSRLPTSPSSPGRRTTASPSEGLQLLCTASVAKRRLYCTVTVGLVAARVNPSFRNSRNWYVPAVLGTVIVHVRVVTPAPT